MKGEVERRLCLLDFDAHSCSDGLSHVTDGEPSERGELFGCLDDHGLGGLELDNCDVTGLEEVGVVGLDLSGLGVDGLDQLNEPAGSLGGVAVEHRGVSDGDDGGVVEDDDLCGERLGDGRRVVDGSCDISSLDIVLCDSTDVESDVVSGNCLGQLLVVHLDGLDLSGNVGGLEHDLHVGLEDSGLDTSDRDGSDSGDGVDILDGQPEGLLGVLLGNLEVVQSGDEGGSLVPGGWRRQP